MLKNTRSIAKSKWTLSESPTRQDRPNNPKLFPMLSCARNAIGNELWFTRNEQRQKRENAPVGPRYSSRVLPRPNKSGRQGLARSESRLGAFPTMEKSRGSKGAGTDRRGRSLLFESPALLLFRCTRPMSHKPCATPDVQKDHAPSSVDFGKARRLSREPSRAIDAKSSCSARTQVYT